MATRILAPGGASPSANSVTTEDGSSPDHKPTREQLDLVIEHFASKIDVLDRMLIAMQCGNLSSDDSVAMLDGAQTISAQLGAMADRFATRKYRSPDEWLFGERFATAGKVGAA